MHAANFENVFRLPLGKNLQMTFGLAGRKDLLRTKSVPFASGYFFAVFAGNSF